MRTKKTGKWVGCSRCGKLIYRELRKLRSNQSGVFRCGANCPGVSKNRLKDRARAALQYQVKIGKIRRRKRCERCNVIERSEDRKSKIEAHHHDYSKPLDVEWICRRCHDEEHKEERAKYIREVGKANRVFDDDMKCLFPLCETLYKSQKGGFVRGLCRAHYYHYTRGDEEMKKHVLPSLKPWRAKST